MGGTMHGSHNLEDQREHDEMIDTQVVNNIAIMRGFLNTRSACRGSFIIIIIIFGMYL
jgi:hypothetical protein